MLKPLLSKSSFPLITKPIFIVVPYGAKPAFSIENKYPRTGRVGRLLDRLFFYSFRQFITSNRDFVANIRNFPYQFGLIKDVLSLNDIEKAGFLVDSTFSEEDLLSEFKELGSVQLENLSDYKPIFDNKYNSVVIVYPDALGLGWAKLESHLTKTVKTPLIFINGRRRVMELNSTTRHQLFWRRIMASTRIIEILLSAIIIPVAMTWALIDSLRGKS